MLEHLDRLSRLSSLCHDKILAHSKQPRPLASLRHDEPIAQGPATPHELTSIDIFDQLRLGKFIDPRTNSFVNLP